MPKYQYREEVAHDFYYGVNYNKPNYYTAFLNGLCENTNDLGPGIDGDGSLRRQPFDFKYFAFGFNRTHLEIAK